MDIVVLNQDLERIGLIDSYTSLIWANRYLEAGDCELYIEATTENLQLLKKGNYLARDDDEMVCRIKTVELDTDTEEGNYIIVKGYDVKDILSQRIIWSQMNIDGKVEDYIRQIVYYTLCNPNLSARAITNSQGRQNFMLGDVVGFTERITDQVSYKNVQEKIQELCKQYDWGYKVIVDVGNFYFCLYKGTDRSDTVIFSHDYENLISTKYIDDSSHLANVALVAGEGEGSERSRNVSGYSESLNRYELYVDARDISRNITWEDLIEMYPRATSGGQGYIDGAYYKMGYISIPIIDDNQLTWLRQNYPNGETITISGQLYYRTYDPIIADLESTSPQSGDTVILRDIVYSVYLLTRGYEKLAEFGQITSFEGAVEPDVTFTYKQDYFLGDKVTVKNEFGITAEARIVEVIETYDNNGYNIEPRFEYKNVDSANGIFLSTENGNPLLTENGDNIIVEE